MHEYDDVVRAYTGFSVSKYASIYGLTIEMVLEEVFRSYDTEFVESRHETLMNIQWESIDNPRGSMNDSSII